MFLAMVATQSAAVAPKSETAVLAGGCYWGVEAVFEHVNGVQDVVSGYAGGEHDRIGNPSTEPAGSFAEAVRITFDPRQISYEDLIAIFMTVAHDPTQINRQGPDIGPRYRSAIFPQNARQRAAATQALTRLKASSLKIATRLETGRFDPAPPDQQDFVKKHPRVPYVVINDLPKLADLKVRYPQFWRA